MVLGQRNILLLLQEVYNAITLIPLGCSAATTSEHTEG
jgi:hypothetical protein